MRDGMGGMQNLVPTMFNLEKVTGQKLAQLSDLLSEFKSKAKLTFDKTLEIETLIKSNLIKLEEVIGEGESEMKNDIEKLMNYKKEIWESKIT